MRRSGPGLAALDRSLHSSAQFSTLGSELTASQLNELHAQLDVFSNALRQFAQQHRRDIVRDPAFRHAFQQMCANIGVDPLAGGPPKSIAASAFGSMSSSSGSGSGAATATAAAASGSGARGRLAGLWNDFLGLSDFQNELSIQIIDVCVSTRKTNGGYIDMRQLVRTLNRMRLGSKFDDAHSSSRGGGEGTNVEGSVTENDVVQSIKLLKPLGSGYEVIRLPNGVTMVRSVPKELNVDSTVVLALLASSVSSHHDTIPRDQAGHPYLTANALMKEMPTMRKAIWTRERADAVLFGMAIDDGLLWIDEGVYPVRYYAPLSAGATAIAIKASTQ